MMAALLSHKPCSLYGFFLSAFQQLFSVMQLLLLYSSTLGLSEHHFFLVFFFKAVFPLKWYTALVKPSQNTTLLLLFCKYYAGEKRLFYNQKRILLNGHETAAFHSVGRTSH